MTKPAAFVEGHPTVVRSLYASGICDFGATYIDARKFPSLEDEFPDLVEQVIVVWQIPPIIPYEVLAFSTKMPQGCVSSLQASFPPSCRPKPGRPPSRPRMRSMNWHPSTMDIMLNFALDIWLPGLIFTTLVKVM